MNDFRQHLILNFYLAIENTDNRALNTLVEYNHNNLINIKHPKTDLVLTPILNIFLALLTLCDFYYFIVL